MQKVNKKILYEYALHTFREILVGNLIKIVFLTRDHSITFSDSVSHSIFLCLSFFPFGTHVYLAYDYF